MSMVRILQFRALVVALVLGAVFCFVAIIGMASAQEPSLIGCWAHESKQGRYTNVYQICLRKDGSVGGITVDNGDGWDWSARWGIVEQSKLSLVFDESNDKIVCKFSLAVGAKLSLSECSEPDYPREFIRAEDASAEASERRQGQESAQIDGKVADDEIRGCWERTDNSKRYPTSLTYCFLAKGELQGWDVDNGHGVDFSGTWSLVETGQLQIKVGKVKTCSTRLNAPRTELILEACNDAGLNGAFEKTQERLAQ